MRVLLFAAAIALSAASAMTFDVPQARPTSPVLEALAGDDYLERLGEVSLSAPIVQIVDQMGERQLRAVLGEAYPIDTGHGTPLAMGRLQALLETLPSHEQPRAYFETFHEFAPEIALAGVIGSLEGRVVDPKQLKVPQEALERVGTALSEEGLSAEELRACVQEVSTRIGSGGSAR